MTPLRNYEDWKHCITELCRIPLTADFIARRLHELRDVESYGARRLVSSWGENHRKQVVAWFERAEREYANQAQ